MKKQRNVPNVNNINVGDVIKNYKELSNILEIKYESGGRERKVQLEDLCRYFDWEKSGNKYLITEVYDKPIPMPLFTKKTKYANDLSNNLLCYFKIKNTEEILVVKNQLMLSVGMCNERYVKKELGLDFDYNFPTEKAKKFNLNEFYKMSNSKLTKILNYSLNSLHKRSLLKWETVYVKGYKSVYFDPIYNIANIDEEKIIGDIIYKKLKEYECNTEYEIAFRNKGEKFYKEVSELVCEELGCDYYYKAYHIILYNIDNINYEIQERINKKELNVTVVNELMNFIDTKQEKELEWGDKDISKYCDYDFYNNQRKMIKYLIELKDKD